MILETLEFDGSTVLCRVCGDKASGFHYGVHACEGCKGFFRRSIQQKIQYRPCLKNQECNIMRVNRNRCQYCRLKKCISVGMSRDAVRFGRVPKKEKAKIMEQMKRINAQSEMNALQSFLENDPEFTAKIITAHFKHCDYTKQKLKGLGDAAWTTPQFINCPAQMACPLNPKPETALGEEGEKWGEVSELFTPAIKNVVNFAKSIPGFQVFSQEDQVTLLKAGTFEVLLVHLAPLFDAKHNTMMFANGKLFKRTTYPVTSNAGFLLDSMFDFSERMQHLDLNEEEIALFSAAVIIASDRPGLRNIDLVEKVQTKVHEGLQKVIRQNHPDDNSLFPKILMKMPDLRTLSILHSEKLSGMTVTSTSSEHVKRQCKSETAVRYRQKSEESTIMDPCSCMSPRTDVLTEYWRNPIKAFIPLSVSLTTSQNSNQDMIHHAHTDYGQSHVPFSCYSNNYNNVTRNQWQNNMRMHQKQNCFPEEFTFDRNKIDIMHRITRKANDHLVQNLKHKRTDQTITTSQLSENITQPVEVNAVTQIFSSESSAEQPDIDISSESGCDDEKKKYNRKRALNLVTSKTEEKIKLKIPRLHELYESDMRSSRSNSVSSISSIDSIDSAYRTMSSPSTPRSVSSIDTFPPHVNQSIRESKLYKSVNTENKKPVLPLTSPVSSSASSSSNSINCVDVIKSDGLVETTTNWSLRKPFHVPLLKRALSVPPMCAQETWFHNPNKDAITGPLNIVNKAQNQQILSSHYTEVRASIPEHNNSMLEEIQVLKDLSKSTELVDAQENVFGPEANSSEERNLEHRGKSQSNCSHIHHNSFIAQRAQESHLHGTGSNIDISHIYRPYYGIHPTLFYQYAALHQHIQALNRYDNIMQNSRTDAPDTDVDNLALKKEPQ